MLAKREIRNVAMEVKRQDVADLVRGGKKHTFSALKRAARGMAASMAVMGIMAVSNPSWTQASPVKTATQATQKAASPAYLGVGQYDAIGLSAIGMRPSKPLLIDRKYLVTNPVETNAVKGYSYITSLNVSYNLAPTNRGYVPLPSIHIATLQENVMVYFKLNGSEYAYWAQDVVSFNTSGKYLSFGAQVWPMNGPAREQQLMLQSKGNGKFYSATSSNSKSHYYFYMYGTPAYTYSDPMGITQTIEFNEVGGHPVLSFWDAIGSAHPVQYDKVVFPSGKSPEINIGLDRLGDNSADLVWGGYGNRSTAVLGSINAKLGIYFDDHKTFKSFQVVVTSTGAKAAYSGGGVTVTAEGADDVHTTLRTNGFAQVSSGGTNTSSFTIYANFPAPTAAKHRKSPPTALYVGPDW
jgi:hypothetical protein